MDKKLLGAVVLVCAIAAVIFFFSRPAKSLSNLDVSAAMQPVGLDSVAPTTVDQKLVEASHVPKMVTLPPRAPLSGRRRAQPTILMTITTTTSSTVSTTTQTTTLFRGVVRGSDVPFYTIKDSIWFKQWQGKEPGKPLPRILIFTWGTEESFKKYLNEVYWKSCYAHTHGFDIVFSSKLDYKTTQSWPMFEHLGYTIAEMNKWAWVHGVLEYIISGAYEYVFMMREDVLIQESNLDFPIWAWDKGHHFTMMDQYHFLWPDAYGLNINDVLFKATWYTRQFLEEFFEYRNGFFIQGEVGPFMETLLRYLGREHPDGYDKKCWRFLSLNKPFTTAMKQEPRRNALLTEYFSQCFFTELERLIGNFGHRTSQSVGFSPTFITQDFQKLIPEQLRWRPGVLGPWANCWRNVRKWWPNPPQNCFAILWKGEQDAVPEDQAASANIKGQCPDATFNWTTSPFNPVNREARLEKGKKADARTLVQNERARFVVSDAVRLEQWAPRLNFPSYRLPRVLIYTWGAEDTFTDYVNEVYWKTCYAFSHAFDVVFSNSKKISGVKEWHGSSGADTLESEKNPWAWVDDIQKYLFSGEYDYVLMMRRDVLIQESFFDFPVWFWDRGNDITIMDQHHFDPPHDFGLNLNNVLFKPTDFTKEFLDEIFEYRKGFYLQDDNGAYMETLLTFLGREANASGKLDYNRTCRKYLELNEPDAVVRKSDETRWKHLNHLYSKCFFDELDRLVGTYGLRMSRNLGFTPTYVSAQDGSQLLPSTIHFEMYSPGPWANCWSSVRSWWTLPAANCFALNWNGQKEGNSKKIQGTCPDLTFPWWASPYNPANRKPPS